MKNGRTLWNEMCYRYDTGLQEVRQFQKVWDNVQPYIDAERFTHVQLKLRKQSRNAQEWKDACLLYFQQFSKMPIPGDIERPLNELDQLIEKDLKRN